MYGNQRDIIVVRILTEAATFVRSIHAFNSIRRWRRIDRTSRQRWKLLWQADFARITEFLSMNPCCATIFEGFMSAGILSKSDKDRIDVARVVLFGLILMDGWLWLIVMPMSLPVTKFRIQQCHPVFKKADEIACHCLFFSLDFFFFLSQIHSL